MTQITLKDLPNKRLWKPAYGRFDQTIVSKRLDSLADAGVDERSLALTRNFVANAFADFTHTQPARTYGFVFAIPTRIARTEQSDISEARHFLPIVDYVSPDVAQIFLSEMPPCVLDEYYDHNNVVVGAIVFVPLFMDMMHDIRPKLRMYLRVRRIIRLTSQFIHSQLQPDIVGLGATLPKITRFGKDLQKHGLRTTTGHGGTVYLIYKMFDELCRKNLNMPSVVGIIGAGSIGSSSADLLLDRYSTLQITIYDIRPAVLHAVVKELRDKYGDRVTAAASNSEVITTGSIIISAITSTIKLPDDMDLSGKIIIDDSQPGSFSKADVEAHGGKIVWVVGKSMEKVGSRHSSFHFGDNGLHGTGDIWGCEAEVATLWHTKSYDRVITAPVTPDAALKIGSLMEETGIERADWQVAGELVDFGEDSA